MSGLFNEASLVLVPSGYKAGKVYSEVPTNGDGDLTFTRASSATRVNSDGEIEVVGSGVPRLDYSQGSCPSLLLEPQRTNTILRSQDLSNASWTKTNVTITQNAITSPIESFNSDAIVENSGTNTVFGFHAASRPSGLTIGTTYSLSFFAKKITRDWCYFDDFNAFQTPRVLVFFNLANGTVGTSQIGVLNPKMENYGNGWYRCSFQFVASSTLIDYRIASATSDNTVSYSGTIGQESISVTACQFETGTYITSYIPTTSTAVTRVSDSFSATGLGEYLGDSEGTLYIEAEQFDNVGFVSIIQAVNSGVTLGVTGSNTFLFNVRVAGATQADIQSGAIFTPNANFKLAGSYKTNDFKFFKDGSSLGTDISGGTFADGNLITIQSNSSFPSNQPFYGRIKQILVFPNALSDDDLTLLTGTLGETYFESYALMANYLNYTVQ